MAKFRIIALDGSKKVGKGEWVDTNFDLSFAYTDKPKMEDFYMGRDHKTVALDKRLQGNDVRIYLFLCDSMAPGGWLEATQAHIAKVFGIHGPAVSASFSRLAACGYVESLIKKGTGRKKWRIVDDYSSKGSYPHRQAIKADAEGNYDKTKEPIK